MKLLITGGAGFIGSHTAATLQAEHEVVIVDNLNNYYDPSFKRANLQRLEQCQFYEADICDRVALEKIFAQHQFDVIIHLAARAGVRPSIQQPELYAQVNILGTLQLLELTRQYNVARFIFGSSSSVYANISPYAATKHAAELLLDTYHKLYQLQVTILRFFTVYGEYGRPDMAPYLFTEALYKSTPIQQFGDGSSTRDYTYVGDIVQGIQAALHHPLPFEIMDLGNHQPVSLRDFIHTLENVTGKHATIEQLPAQVGDVDHTCADITKAQQLLKYHPTTSLTAGLERFVRWFEQNRL